MSSTVLTHLNGNTQEIAKFQSSLASLCVGDSFLDLEGTQSLDAINMLAKVTANAFMSANGAKYPDTSYGKALTAVA